MCAFTTDFDRAAAGFSPDRCPPRAALVFIKKYNPAHTTRGDRHIRPRPGARRVCPPLRRRVAAAGSGRMPNARGSATWARLAHLAAMAGDDVLGW